MNILRFFGGLLSIMISYQIHACEKYSDDNIIVNSKSEAIERHIILIDNQTEDNCYFWVDPTFAGQIEPQLLIRRYFWSTPKGYDFSFGHLITEPNIEFCDYKIRLGYNFIKRLSPGESFRLIIKSNKEACKYYKNHIVIMCEKEFQKYFYKIPDFFLYKDDYIVIEEAEIPVGI